MRRLFSLSLLLLLTWLAGPAVPQLTSVRYDSASGCYTPAGNPGHASFSAAISNLAWDSCLRLGRPLAGSAVSLSTSATNWAVTSNLAVPANILLKLEPGSPLLPASGVTLTLGSCPDAGPYRIFGGAGTVTFSAGACHFVYPEWWYDGGGDWTNALNKATAAVSASKGTVLLGAKSYQTSGVVLYYAGITIQGVSFKDSIIAPTTGTALSPADVDAIYERNTFKDFSVICAGETIPGPYTCSVGIRYGSMRRSHLENVFIQMMQNDGLLFLAGEGANPYYNTFTNLWVRNVESGDCFHQEALSVAPEPQPNGTRIIGGHCGAVAVGLNIVHGSTGSVSGGMSIEGVTSQFMQIGGNAWMVSSIRMENNNYLPPGSGIVFVGDDVRGFTMTNTTLVGGSVNTSPLSREAYCITNSHVNGEIQPDECPMKDIAGPLSMVGNPWGCFGMEENLAKATEFFNASDWTTTSGSITVNANAVADPLGTMTAEEVLFTGATTNVRAQETTTTASGQTVYYGAWLKSPTYGRIQWELATIGPGTDPVERGQWNLTPGWQYHYITHRYCTAGSGGCLLDASDIIRIGFRHTNVDNMVDTLHVWGVQLGLGTQPRCYVGVTGGGAIVQARNKTTIRTKIDATSQSIRITNADVCDDSLFDVDDHATLCLDNNANAGAGALCARVSGTWRCVNLN